MTLMPVDPKNEANVVTLLEHAAQWLSEAVHRGEAGDIAVGKAQLATAYEATKQLGLSKEIRLDAQEMVRRAEYALGRAIRRGQEEGTVLRHREPRVQVNQHGTSGVPDPSRYTKPSPTDFATEGELSGNGAGIYHLVPAAPDEFDEAVAEARAEGDLSRANLVRKVKGRAVPPGRRTRAEKAALIGELAAQGYTSRQMCEEVGFSRDDAVRELAREYDIDIPADKAVNRTRRISSTDVAANTVTALEGLVMGVELIDYDALDLTQASQWVDSLSHSLKVLTRFRNQIKETTHD